MLSPREREVLVLLAEGRSNREIASAMTVTVATVKTHLVHIYAKLGAGNRNEALGRALDLRAARLTREHQVSAAPRRPLSFRGDPPILTVHDRHRLHERSVDRVRRGHVPRGLARLPPRASLPARAMG